MYVPYLILITLLNNVFSYKPNRKIESISKSNKKIEVTPARYHIANSNTNTDAKLNQETPVDYFPGTEYPTSLMESSKPFYISTSPFPKDVKTSFDSLTSKSVKNVANPDYSAIKDEIAKAKDKFISLLKQDTEADNTTSVDTATNEADIETDEIGVPVTDFEDPLTNLTLAEESFEDVDYLLGLYKELDEVVTHLDKIDNFKSDYQNSTECSNDMQCTADETSKNNVSLIEFYGNSLPLTSMEQSYSLFDECDAKEAPIDMSWCVVTNKSEITSDVDDMQESIFEIWKTANETSYDDGL